MNVKLSSILTIFLLILSAFVEAQNSNTITISGCVTDFNNTPIDSSVIRILHRNFNIAYETYTDKNGDYILKDVDKGQYMAMFVMRPQENKIPKDKMRLEYWA